jgi:hypothetical protein
MRLTCSRRQAVSAAVGAAGNRWPQHGAAPVASGFFWSPDVSFAQSRRDCLFAKALIFNSAFRRQSAIGGLRQYLRASARGRFQSNEQPHLLQRLSEASPTAGSAIQE